MQLNFRTDDLQGQARKTSPRADVEEAQTLLPGEKGKEGEGIEEMLDDYIQRRSHRHETDQAAPAEQLFLVGGKKTELPIVERDAHLRRSFPKRPEGFWLGGVHIMEAQVYFHRGLPRQLFEIIASVIVIPF